MTTENTAHYFADITYQNKFLVTPEIHAELETDGILWIDDILLLSQENVEFLQDLSSAYSAVLQGMYDLGTYQTWFDAHLPEFASNTTCANSKDTNKIYGQIAHSW